jgi:hypothetical protein
MNTTEYHRIKLQGSDAVSDAVVGIADELFEMRKDNDKTLYQLKSIAGSLDYISQYLYDISWELKKKNEETLDKTTQS